MGQPAQLSPWHLSSFCSWLSRSPVSLMRALHSRAGGRRCHCWRCHHRCGLWARPGVRSGSCGYRPCGHSGCCCPCRPCGPPLHPVNTVPVVSTAAVTHTLPYHVYGKRDADPEPYTVGQIAAGAHIANALADGRPHNVGVITNAAVHYPAVYSVPHYVYGKRESDPALLT